MLIRRLFVDLLRTTRGTAHTRLLASSSSSFTGDSTGETLNTEQSVEQSVEPVVDTEQSLEPALDNTEQIPSGFHPTRFVSSSSFTGDSTIHTEQFVEKQRRKAERKYVKDVNSKVDNLINTLNSKRGLLGYMNVDFERLR